LDLGGKRKQGSGEDYKRRSFMIIVFIKHSFYQIKNADRSGPCGSVGDMTGSYRELVGRPEGKENTWKT
jgi:hypothetical protein